MKRILALLAAAVLLCGCAAQRAVPQPVVQNLDPQETAAQLWLKLSQQAQPAPLDLKMTARLLELKETDLAEGIALLNPEDPGGAQMFLLRAAPKKGQRLQTALQNRLELVRQTSAAVLGSAADSQSLGCVVSAGEWYALLVPSEMEEERTQQARQTFLAAFE